jgi:hypothetical protein
MDTGMIRKKTQRDTKNVTDLPLLIDHDDKDDAIAAVIAGLNVLIAQASGADMGMAARILYNAKEELVHWAVDMDFHETAKERFINHHLYETGHGALGDVLARVSALQDEQLKNELIRMLGASLAQKSHLPEGN